MKSKQFSLVLFRALFPSFALIPFLFAAFSFLSYFFSVPACFVYLFFLSLYVCRLIKLTYRKKSLFVHPDKCKHAKAEEAFSLLATAQTTILEEDKRTNFSRVQAEAKTRLLEEKKLAPTDPFLETAEFAALLKRQMNKILADVEWRKRQMIRKEMEEQGKKEIAVEQAALEKKRKQEEEKAWEDTRENRVASWRDFQTKKKKKGPDGELRPPKSTQEDSSKTFIKRVTKQ